jgi:hypothetical protein
MDILKDLYAELVVVVSSLINVWYGSYLGPCRLLYTQGKVINWQEENPCWCRGWKNPISIRWIRYAN